MTVVFLFIYFHYFDLSKNFFLFILSLVFIYSFIAVNLYIKDKTNKDPKEVVIDEFIGQSIPIYLYEISHGTVKTFNESIYIYFVIFILFRLFDIKKPFPVSYFDKNFKNSFGVGARLLLNTVIVRVDQGFSEEGAETTIYIGYPF